MHYSLHTANEADPFGPRLWDASPGVCCAAFQLGACCHTEADQGEDEWYAMQDDLSIAPCLRCNAREAQMQDGFCAFCIVVMLCSLTVIDQCDPF